ncbi:hypothetical protein J1N35_004211 [Gossypium stocksii]|uniref:Uncharacterized protein n=1 Tax=Gossypium stocksii TaxID=47602 RepID=A0A9D3WBQ1_9ROSI|nr:hypothetical protein J1N35_004211 [Gossypium stocksii]
MRMDIADTKNPNYGGNLYNNPTPGPHLQIHSDVIISTETNVGERTNNGEDFDQDVEDFSDPDIDEVLDDMDDESLEEVEHAHDPSFSNLSCGIILRNEPRGDMLILDPNVTHASEFPEHANIVPAHRLSSNSQLEELFIGQRFENKANYHRKLDAKSIYNYIMPLKKDNPTIPMLTLITDMQARFQYRVSYRKEWMNRHEKFNRLRLRCCQIRHYVGNSKVDQQ